MVVTLNIIDKKVLELNKPYQESFDYIEKKILEKGLEYFQNLETSYEEFYLFEKHLDKVSSILSYDRKALYQYVKALSMAQEYRVSFEKYIENVNTIKACKENNEKLCIEVNNFLARLLNTGSLLK